MPDRHAEHMSENVSDWRPHRMSDRMPHRMSDTLSVYMSERLPDGMSKYMSNRMPDRIRKYMSNKCQNILKISPDMSICPDMPWSRSQDIKYIELQATPNMAQRSTCT